MVEHRGRGEPVECAARLGRNVRVQLCQSFHMRFVDHCVPPTCFEGPPVHGKQRRVRYNRFRDIGCAVAAVEGEVRLGKCVLVPEGGGMVGEAAVKLARVRVDQQFVAIETMSCLRVVGSGGPVAIKRARLHSGNIPVPDSTCAFR